MQVAPVQEPAYVVGMWICIQPPLRLSDCPQNQLLALLRLVWLQVVRGPDEGWDGTRAVGAGLECSPLFDRHRRSDQSYQGSDQQLPFARCR